MNVLFIITFWFGACYASQATPREADVSELVKIYKEEEVNMAEQLYQSQKDLTPAIELVWKEVQMIVSNPGPQGEKVAGERWSHSYSTDNLLMPYTDYGNDFTTMAEVFLANDYPVHAVVVYFTAARIEKLEDNGMYTIISLRFFTRDIGDAVMHIAGKKLLNRDLINDITTLMKEIVGFVRSTKSAREDDRVEQEAWCLTRIGSTYGMAGQYKDMAEENKLAVEIMYEQFGERAEVYCVYAIFLLSISGAYVAMGDFNTAKKYFDLALKACEKSEDWPVEEIKKAFELTASLGVEYLKTKL